MLTRDARIAAIKNKAAVMLEQAAKLEEQKAKEQADTRRKADAAAKLLLGAGMLLLEPAKQAHTVSVVLSRLSPRDRSRVEAWAADRGLVLAAPVVPALTATTLVGDDEAAALKRVVSRFDAGGLSLLATEFLGASEGEDRAVLEQFFARLAQPKDGNVQPT